MTDSALPHAEPKTWRVAGAFVTQSTTSSCRLDAVAENFVIDITCVIAGSETDTVVQIVTPVPEVARIDRSNVVADCRELGMGKESFRDARRLLSV